MTNIPEWEKQFDQRFPTIDYFDDGKPFGSPEASTTEVKAFISRLLTKTVQVERERITRIIETDFKGSYDAEDICEAINNFKL